jgi:hypothetical protein
MNALRMSLVCLAALLTPVTALAGPHGFRGGGYHGGGWGHGGGYHGGEGFRGRGWGRGGGDRDGWHGGYRGRGDWDDHYRGWGHRWYGGRWIAPAPYFVTPGYASYCVSVGLYYPQVTYCPEGWVASRW